MTAGHGVAAVTRPDLVPRSNSRLTSNGGRLANGGAS